MLGNIKYLTKGGTTDLLGNRVLVVRRRTNPKDKIHDDIIIIMDVTVIKYLGNDSFTKAYVMKLRSR